MVMTASLTASAYASVPTVEDIYNSYPVYDGNDLELIVDNSGTHFTLWSPAVQNVRVLIYDKDRNGVAIDTLEMHPGEKGVWRAAVPQMLYGKFYTFQVQSQGRWLAETPGIYAKAVGTNGKRAAIINMSQTNPQ